MFNRLESEEIDIAGEIPKEDTARQSFYIEKCKEFYRKDPSHNTYCLTTFGCQMNEKQSEVIAGIMDEIGYRRIETEDADIVIYNTCTVRENANLKVYGRLGLLHNMKKQKKEKKIILFGCMMQEEHVVNKIRNDYRFVDLVFGTHNIYRFAELFYHMMTGEQQVIESW